MQAPSAHVAVGGVQCSVPIAVTAWLSSCVGEMQWRTATGLQQAAAEIRILYSTPSSSALEDYTTPLQPAAVRAQLHPAV